MRARTLGSLAVDILLYSILVSAQTPQLPGTVVPVPPAPRQAPSVPPRDIAPTQSAIGTARIRGRVTAADTGNPLRRAQVRINNMEGRVNRGATTDGDGRFDFDNLPAGRYSINVSKPGYVPLQFGQQRAFEPGKPLPLSEGQLADRVDFALPRGGVITGRLTDEHGEPAPGVRVQAMRYQYGSNGQRRLVPGSTGMFGPQTTDDRGEFRVFGLSPGTYILSAVPSFSNMWIPPEGITSAALSASAADPNEGYATTYYPGVSSPSEAQPIPLGLSQETAVSFPLVAARLSRLSGMIRNSQGQPVTEAQLSLRPAQPGMFSNSPIQLGKDGAFLANGVAPGEYFIDVHPLVTYTPGKPPPPAPADAELASFPITVTGTDIGGINIITRPAAIITGRVIFDGTSERPTGQVRVAAVPADDYGGNSFMMRNTPDNGRVDENGQLQIRGLSGKVLFRAGAGRWNLRSVTIDGIDITDVPYDTPPGGSVTGLAIVLTDRAPEISGTATNRLGEPVKDYVVVVVPNNLSDRIVPGRFTTSLRSDDKGRYQTRFLPPGSYFTAAVESHDPWAQWDPVFQEIVRSRGRGFTLTEGQTLTLDLQLLQ